MPWRPLDGESFPSLGYHVADQMAEYLNYFVVREQLEFLIRFYEIDPFTGKRVKRRGVIQRPRGWGKSPKLAAIGISEALFEVVPDGWDADGQPVARPWSDFKSVINVPITATSDDQVQNTWAPLLDMARGDALVNAFDVDPMETFIAIPGGKIEPRTSSGRSIKGLPGQVCAIMDQTEEWVRGNGGLRLAQNIRNNATKASGVTLESPNAFTPGEGSVAEKSARDWDLIKSGKHPKLSDARILLYDHREAPADTDPADQESLVYGLRYAYGDSSNHPDGCIIHTPPCEPGWADIAGTALAFLDTSNDPQVLRADFLNQITHAADSYLSQPELRAILDESKVIGKSEPITLGFDGSEGRKDSRIADSTVLIGYSVTQKHLFKVGVWEQPDGPAGEGWRPPQLEIEQAVKDAFRKYNIVGFFADPSAGWAGQVKTWEADYNRRLKVKLTANEPIRWRQKDVSRTCEAFEQMHSAIVSGDITFDGSKELTAHFLNARRDARRAGYVLKKPDDDQDYAKVDAAWGAMFAFAAGLEALGKGVTNNRKGPARRIY
ncbi:MAG TPA: hypothetical protein VNJ54_07985 [Plantibacter sp.]|uniref:hypothetical protein n=1 Tax=Plantibacter sp. TaxID=1871045 RepID=UPI002B9F6725|nr:hypothetical protein [Plantibacter sp.]